MKSSNMRKFLSVGVIAATTGYLIRMVLAAKPYLTQNAKGQDLEGLEEAGKLAVNAVEVV